MLDMNSNAADSMAYMCLNSRLQEYPGNEFECSKPSLRHLRLQFRNWAKQPSELDGGDHSLSKILDESAHTETEL